MERFLARLERRFGRFAIENVGTFIAGGMAIVFVLSLIRPEFVSMLYLDLGLVRRGQLWRLVSYLFLPRSTSPIWVLLDIYMVWLIARALEVHWGAFKLNVYYFVGMLGAMAAAWITGGGEGNWALNLSMFFAYATLFPENEFLIFIIPVKVKWLALIAAAFTAYSFLGLDPSGKAALIAAFANYFVFFGGTLFALLRNRRVSIAQAERRQSFRPPRQVVREGRTCAICGASETDGADIRVCSCEKCGQPRTLCLPHARNH